MHKDPNLDLLSHSSIKKNYIYLFAFVLIFLIFVAHSFYLSVVAEDAFISFRYANNLVNGFGLVWNIDEPPVEGYTNFLWVIFCSMGLLLNLKLTIFSQLLGILSSVITLIYVYKIGTKILGFKTKIALIPCLLLAVSGPFATWASSGMETNLFTLFIVCSIYYELNFWLNYNKSSLIFLFLFLLLAALTRPEGFGFFLILIVLHFIKSKGNISSASSRQLISAALIFFIIPFTVYFLWRFSYFGYLLPNTYYAKTGGCIFQWIRGFAYILYFCLHFLLPAAPLLIILIWISIEKLKTKALIQEIRLKIKNDIRAYAIFVFLSVCLFYSVYIIYIGGDYMAMYRFLVPVLPFVYLLLTKCYYILLTSTLNTYRRNFTYILLIFFILGTVVQSTPLDKFIFAKFIRQNGQYQGVLFERWHSNRLTLLGKFFNSYKTSHNESIATDAIGAIAYYSGLKVYDYHGLVDPYIAHLEKENLGKGLPGHEKKDFVYTLSKRPTFLLFNRDLTKQQAAVPVYPERIRATIESEYEIVSVWLKDDLNNESGYFNFFQKINR
jgi:hypothetical protein